MAKPYYDVKLKLNLKSKSTSITKSDPKPEVNIEDDSLIDNSYKNQIDNFYRNQIRSLYDYVINRFRSGDYAVYNPRLLYYLTIDRFTEWVFENNPDLNLPS
jgi:hypothetical protein